MLSLLLIAYFLYNKNLVLPMVIIAINTISYTFLPNLAITIVRSMKSMQSVLSYITQLFFTFLSSLLFLWSLYCWRLYFKCTSSMLPEEYVQNNLNFGFLTQTYNYVLESNLSESDFVSFKFFSNFFFFDGISILFIILTTFIFCICFLLTFSEIRSVKFSFLLFSLEILILLVFLTSDFLFFYICFELILIPMVVLILLRGSRDRKIKATYYFFVYTFLGSICLLVSIIYIYFFYNTTNIITIQQIFSLFNSTAEFHYYRDTTVVSPYMSLDDQALVLFLLFIGFAVKIPVFPFHLWLPEAHVEAPTVGSVLLAALLLKLGGYGFLRFVIPLVPQAINEYNSTLQMFFLMSIFFSSLAIVRQIDLKKIIAYSSIGHMNFMLLGMFSLNYEGITSSIYLMIAHGLTSSALFILIGILYDRYHTRLLHYYGGLVVTMPYFVFFFIFFNLSNFGFPGTSNFVGEFLVFLGLAENNLNVFLISLVGFIFSGVYSVMLINRICFGTVKSSYITFYQDLLKREHYILLILMFSSVFLGFFPSLFIATMDLSVSHLLQSVLPPAEYVVREITFSPFVSDSFEEIIGQDPELSVYNKDLPIFFRYYAHIENAIAKNISLNEIFIPQSFFTDLLAEAFEQGNFGEVELYSHMHLLVRSQVVSESVFNYKFLFAQDVYLYYYYITENHFLEDFLYDPGIQRTPEEKHALVRAFTDHVTIRIYFSSPEFWDINYFIFVIDDLEPWFNFVYYKKYFASYYENHVLADGTVISEQQAYAIYREDLRNLAVHAVETNIERPSELDKETFLFYTKFYAPLTNEPQTANEIFARIVEDYYNNFENKNESNVVEKTS